MFVFLLTSLLVIMTILIVGLSCMGKKTGVMVFRLKDILKSYKKQII